MPPWTSRSVACSLALTCLAGGTAYVQTPPAGQPDSPRATVDIRAFDSAGRPVLDLAAEELVVTIDGQPRPVRSLRYVYQGAGAEEAARGGPTGARALAEPARVVVIAIDENTIQRGREKAVASAAWRVIDSLTPTDLIGVMALPQPRGQTSLLADRGPLRPALNGISGRARGESAVAQAVTPPPPVDPTNVSAGEEIDRLQRPEAPVARGTPSPGSAQPRSESPADPANASEDSFRTLRLALDNLSLAPGRKHLVYVTGGEDRREDIGDTGWASGVRDIVDGAARARTSIHVVLVPERDGQRTGAILQQLAKDTGGTSSTVTAKRTDLGAFTAALSGSYLAEVDRLAADQADRSSTLSVETSRKGVRLVAPSRWCARSDPVPEPPPAAAAPATAAATEPRAAAGSTTGVRGVARDPELDVVLARVARYVDTYLTELGSVVAEETYSQVVRRGNSVLETRRTRADLLLLRAEEDWIPFRDVFEVDGRPVRDREDRLKKLFLENPSQALMEGRRITEESARYNVGLVYRTINTPNVALAFFRSTLLPTFRFERRGAETMDGVPVWRIDYRETGRPTRIRQGRTGEDLPSTGSIWVEPASGRIVRTLLKNGDAGTAVEVYVRYQANDAIGVWTPARMEERYWSASGRRDTISTEASYSAFRRFQVDTAEAVGPPK